jgi:hypothetical protein
MFRATVKLAFGSFKTSMEIGLNLSTRQVIDRLQTAIKSGFNVEADADIQIVLQNDLRYCEMTPELTYNSVLRPVNELFFYARIIRRINNVEYIKTDDDGQTSYLEKQEVERMVNGQINRIRYLSEREIGVPLLAPLLAPPSSPVSPSQTQCVLCQENDVNDERMFQCIHLFCNDCLSSWRANATQYRCPLCRS